MSPSPWGPWPAIARLGEDQGELRPGSRGTGELARASDGTSRGFLGGGKPCRFVRFSGA